MSLIYFDNNATTAVAPEVREAMIPFLSDHFGNPSSAHRAGREVKTIVERSREEVASLIGAASPHEIFFTSGGTESDNWAILGALEMQPEKRHIVTTRVEHEAVRKLCERLALRGYEVSWLDVDGDGLLDPGQLRDALRPDTAVVSIMLANNETGVIFPVADLAEIIRSRSEALIHVDGVNAAGKIPIDVAAADIDLLAVSAHKFHGPKGTGALYVRTGVQLPSRFIGGGQEFGRRAGTEAVHQIAGLGKASELAKDLSDMSRIADLRNRLEYEILQKIPNSRLNGTSDQRFRLPNTSSISFIGLNGEMILGRLDAAGIAVSTGSACNSGSHTASAVMTAMGIPYEHSMGSIRFSLGRTNTAAEVDAVLAALPPIISDLRSISGF